MEYFKDELYDIDSDLWEAVYDDPDVQDLTSQEKVQLAEAIRNVKVTVH